MKINLLNLIFFKDISVQLVVSLKMVMLKKDSLYSNGRK